MSFNFHLSFSTSFLKSKNQTMEPTKTWSLGSIPGPAPNVATVGVKKVAKPLGVTPL
jgi:hypothetical protein